MNKGNIALALVFMLPAAIMAIAFLFIIPSAIAGIVPVSGSQPWLVKSAYKCGDCTNGWTEECRTLYHIDYFSNGAKTISIAKTAPESEYSYCYNKKFVKINWKESYKCIGNISYKIKDSKLPSSFKWSQGTSWPTYCDYGCNQRTGECKTEAEQATTTAQVKPAPTPKPAAKKGTITGYLAGKSGNVSNKRGSQTTTSSHTSTSSYRAGTKPPVVTSNYGILYLPSSKWTCDSTGRWKVPVDVSGNWIWSSAKRCDNGCKNGSCIDSAGTCTYHSECPDGYYCKRLESGNACRPSRMG
ncbi:MAG: hypothetical protein NT067_00560 [Candidatus Diapherotrites archaeon]|nr:hypothetical protein [Candidatus Diapherotrites archaeon]